MRAPTSVRATFVKSLIAFVYFLGDRVEVVLLAGSQAAHRAHRIVNNSSALSRNRILRHDDMESPCQYCTSSATCRAES